MCQMLYRHSHNLSNLTLPEWCHHPGRLRVVTQVMPHTTLDCAVFTDYRVGQRPPVVVQAQGDSASVPHPKSKSEAPWLSNQPKVTEEVSEPRFQTEQGQ